MAFARNSTPQPSDAPPCLTAYHRSPACRSRWAMRVESGVERSLLATLAAPKTRPLCTLLSMIAPASSDCCAVVLGHSRSGLSDIAADGSRRSDVSSWPNSVAPRHPRGVRLLPEPGRRRVSALGGPPHAGREGRRRHVRSLASKDTPARRHGAGSTSGRGSLFSGSANCARFQVLPPAAKVTAASVTMQPSEGAGAG